MIVTPRTIYNMYCELDSYYFHGDMRDRLSLLQFNVFLDYHEANRFLLLRGGKAGFDEEDLYMQGCFIPPCCTKSNAPYILVRSPINGNFLRYVVYHEMLHFYINLFCGNLIETHEFLDYNDDGQCKLLCQVHQNLEHSFRHEIWFARRYAATKNARLGGAK